MNVSVNGCSPNPVSLACPTVDQLLLFFVVVFFVFFLFVFFSFLLWLPVYIFLSSFHFGYFINIFVRVCMQSYKLHIAVIVSIKLRLRFSFFFVQ